MSLRQATELLRQHDYPATTNQLADSHGDYELDLPNGSETLGEVLRLGDDEVLHAPGEAEATLYCAVGEGAIGRKGYSDRDPTTLGTTGPEQVSF